LRQGREIKVKATEGAGNIIKKNQEKWASKNEIERVDGRTDGSEKLPAGRRGASGGYERKEKNEKKW